MEIESITNKIINDDCINILKQLPDKCIDLVVTSPPYDNLRTYNNSLEWSFEIFQNIAKELSRTLKDGGVIVWIVADAKIKNSKTLTSFQQALYFKELGLNIHDLRGSYIDMVLSSGLSPKFAQNQVGHSKTETTLNVYAQNNRDMVDTARLTINNIFSNKEKNKEKNLVVEKSNVIPFPKRHTITG